MVKHILLTGKTAELEGILFLSPSSYFSLRCTYLSDFFRGKGKEECSYAAFPPQRWRRESTHNPKANDQLGSSEPQAGSRSSFHHHLSFFSSFVYPLAHTIKA